MWCTTTGATQSSSRKRSSLADAGSSRTSTRSVRSLAMSGTLMVAAGGGGDVLGAALIQQALAGSDGGRPVHYASWSWDRLVVDPVPGPRDPTAFCGLRSVGN